MTILIDGSPKTVQAGERLIDVIGRSGVELPHVCYHPQLGPIQTCDTCLVDVDGDLVRACATLVSQDMSVRTITARAQSARLEAAPFQTLAADLRVSPADLCNAKLRLHSRRQNLHQGGCTLLLKP